MEGPGRWAQADVWQPLPLGGSSRHPGILVSKNKGAPEMLIGLWIWSFLIFPNYKMFQSIVKIKNV